MGVGQLLIQRLALGVQREERRRDRASGRSGAAVGRSDALPRLLGVDVEQHDHVVFQRAADALGEHAAAAERDHCAGRRLGEQLADELLLGGPERPLAVAGDERLRRRGAGDAG